MCVCITGIAACCVHRNRRAGKRGLALLGFPSWNRRHRHSHRSRTAHDEDGIEAEHIIGSSESMRRRHSSVDLDSRYGNRRYPANLLRVLRRYGVRLGPPPAAPQPLPVSSGFVLPPGLTARGPEAVIVPSPAAAVPHSPQFAPPSFLYPHQGQLPVYPPPQSSQMPITVPVSQTVPVREAPTTGFGPASWYQSPYPAPLPATLGGQGYLTTAASGGSFLSPLPPSIRAPGTQMTPSWAAPAGTAPPVGPHDFLATPTGVSRWSQHIAVPIASDSARAEQAARGSASVGKRRGLRRRLKRVQSESTLGSDSVPTVREGVVPSRRRANSFQRPGRLRRSASMSQALSPKVHHSVRTTTASDSSTVGSDGAGARILRPQPLAHSSLRSQGPRTRAHVLNVVQYGVGGGTADRRPEPRHTRRDRVGHDGDHSGGSAV